MRPPPRTLPRRPPSRPPVALAACATVGVSSERYLGVPAGAPTEPALRRDPPQGAEAPARPAGEVFLSPSDGATVDAIETALRDRGREARRRTPPSSSADRTKRVGTSVVGDAGGSATTSPVYGRQIVAVAIRYQER